MTLRSMRLSIWRTLMIASLVLITPFEASSAGTPITLTKALPVETAQVVLTGAGQDNQPLDDVLPDAPSIVHFWATWCGPCRAELPEIEQFTQDLDAAGLGDRLVLISVDRSDYDRVEMFLRGGLGLDELRSFQDVTGKAGSVFRLFGYPNTVLLDGEHRIVGRAVGPLDWNGPDVRARLQKHIGETF